MPYFHVVYTLPSELRDIAYQNKRVVYDLLMKAAAETTLAIASDPKRLGARIGVTAVLHTWGSALTHHPHVHMIVPGGGLSLDGARWVAARSNFLVHVKVLARLFRGKMLAMLMHAHNAGELKFFNTHAGLADKRTFKRFIAPLRRIKWVVYCKAPFAGPEQVLRYLSRYTHRVAISNRRLVAADDDAIAFRWKDYRINGPGRWKTMRLHPHEFIRRFLLHVLPKGFHRIRHYGLFASANRAENIATARALLNVAPPAADPQEQPDVAPDTPRGAALPMPALWRSHDRHRDLRARLRAEVATDTEQDRHVMSQTSCERCGFPVPMRWLHAGGDLSRPNHIHQCADRPLMRSERPPKCLLHSPDLRRVQTSQVASCWRPAHHRDRRQHYNPHSTRCQPVPNFPRLRALALFGRRPPSARRVSLCRRPKTCTGAELDHQSAGFTWQQDGIVFAHADMSGASCCQRLIWPAIAAPRMGASQTARAARCRLASKQRRTGASRRVDRSVGDRDQEQVNKR